MPKRTFLNLPGEKRERIINCAIDELYEHRYAGFNISRFVERAKIAKGSFYQYFDDKEDLYLYVVSLFADLKAAMFDEELAKTEDLPLFDLLRQLVAHTARLIKEYPKLLKISVDMLRDTDQQPYQKLFERYPIKSEDFFLELLQKKKKQGELDPNVDSKLLSVIFTGVINNWSLTAGDVEAEGYLREFFGIIDSLEYILAHKVIYSDFKK